MDRNEVSVALEIALEEIEVVVDSLNQDGSGAFQKGDYDSARDLIEVATRLTEFRAKVRTLQKEWENLFSAHVTKKPIKRRSFKHLRRGLRTQEDTYRHPILEALVELGGSASISKVLDKVGEKMEGTLNEYDKQPSPSNPDSTRWRNSVQWCRNTMVVEGLMKSDSPRGIWEISQQGKDALARGDVA